MQFTEFWENFASANYWKYRNSTAQILVEKTWKFAKTMKVSSGELVLLTV